MASNMDWPCRNGDCRGRLQLGMAFCNQCGGPAMHPVCATCPDVHHTRDARRCIRCGNRLNMSADQTDDIWDAGSEPYGPRPTGAGHVTPPRSPPNTNLTEAMLLSLSSLFNRNPSFHSSESNQDGQSQVGDIPAASLLLNFMQLEGRFADHEARCRQLQSNEDISRQDRAGIYKRYFTSHPEITAINADKVTITWEGIDKELYKGDCLVQDELIGYKLKFINPDGEESELFARLDEASGYNLVIGQTGKYKLSMCYLFKGGLSDYCKSLQFEIHAKPRAPSNVKQNAELTTHNSIGVTWDINTGVYKVAKMIIQYKLESVNQQPNELEIEERASEYTIDGLNPGQAYEVRVCSVCEYLGSRQSEFSEYTTMYTRPTSPPRDVRGRNTGRRCHYNLQWRTPEYIGQEVYIERYLLEDVNPNGIAKWKHPVDAGHEGEYNLSPFNTKGTTCVSFRIKAVCGTDSPEVRYHSQWVTCVIQNE